MEKCVGWQTSISCLVINFCGSLCLAAFQTWANCSFMKAVLLWSYFNFLCTHKSCLACESYFLCKLFFFLSISPFFIGKNKLLMWFLVSFCQSRVSFLLSDIKWLIKATNLLEREEKKSWHENLFAFIAMRKFLCWLILRLLKIIFFKRKAKQFWQFYKMSSQVILFAKLFLGENVFDEEEKEWKFMIFHQQPLKISPTFIVVINNLGFFFYSCN